MFKTGLQLFAEAVSGKKIVYLYRLAGKAKEEAAKNLAFTTENGRTKSKDAVRRILLCISQTAN